MMTRLRRGRCRFFILATLITRRRLGWGCTLAAWAKTPKNGLPDLKLLREMQEQSDIGTMADLLERAKGGNTPSVIKAGFVLRNMVKVCTQKRFGDGKWYGPSFVTIAGAMGIANRSRVY